MPGVSFIDRVQALSPAMFTVLLRGAPECFDIYNRARIINNNTYGPVWRAGRRGYCFANNVTGASTGSISIVDSGAAPELQAASGLIFWTAQRFQIPATVEASHRVYSKADAGGTSLDLYCDGAGSANRLVLYNGASTSIVTNAALTGAHTVAVRFAAGTIPELFADGTFRGNFSANFTPGVNDANLYLANYFNGATGSRRNEYGAFVLINNAILGRAVTDAEIKDWHLAWEAIRSVFEPKRTIWLPRKAADVVAPTPLAHLSGGISPANLWLDSSGNGRDGTVSGRVTSTHVVDRTCLCGYGVGDPLIQSAISFGYDAANWTLEFDFIARSTGAGGQGALFALTDGGIVRALLCFSAANTLSYSITHDTTTGVWTFSSGLYNVWHRLIIRHARSGLGSPVVTLDGEVLAVANPTPPVGALTALAAPRVNLLNVSALTADFDGCISDFKFYDSVLSDADARALYVQQALQCNVLAHMTDSPVTPAAAAAGLSAGPWRVVTGTHFWENYGVGDSVKRRLRGVAAGYVASRNVFAQAYGAWYYRVMKGTDVNVFYMPLIGSGQQQPTAASFNGYLLTTTVAEAVAIRRFTGGVSAVVAQTADGAIAFGVEYEFFVTRRARDGLFTVWARGGAYANWTSLLTGTDNTHVMSTCLVGYMDTAGYITDVMLFPGGETLLPTELPT